MLENANVVKEGISSNRLSAECSLAVISFLEGNKEAAFATLNRVMAPRRGFKNVSTLALFSKSTT